MEEEAEEAEKETDEGRETQKRTAFPLPSGAERRKLIRDSLVDPTAG